MQGRVTYEYAVIRVVPKVEREEFLNVGVILFSKPKKFLGIKFKIDEQRIRALSEEIDMELVSSHLSAWEQVCQGAPEGGRIGELDVASRFRWLTACRSTIIQSSKTHPGLCRDPQAVLEELFHFYVQ